MPCVTAKILCGYKPLGYRKKELFMTIISPSVLSADFAYLADDIKKVEAAGAKYLHLDVMDGAQYNIRRAGHQAFKKALEYRF